MTDLESRIAITRVHADDATKLVCWLLLEDPFADRTEAVAYADLEGGLWRVFPAENDGTSDVETPNEDMAREALRSIARDVADDWRRAA